MGRPTINDEFNEFFLWMRSTRRCSPGVAKTYASYMRRVSKELEGDVTDAEKVRLYFANAYDSDQGYAKLRAAWSVFVEWYLVEKQQNLPIPDPANLIRVKNSNVDRPGVKLSSLSDDVRRSLRVLRLNGITMNQVAKLRWADVDIKDLRSKIVTHIKVPNKNSHWVIPTDAMVVLFNYANVGLEFYKPLVPREPSSDIPYPYPGLLREVEIMTQEELDELDAPSDTSALGAALLRKMNKEQPKEVEETKATMTTKDLLRILDEAPPRPIPTTYDPANYAVFRTYEDRFKGTPQPYDHLLQGGDDDDEDEEDVRKPIPVSVARAALSVPKPSESKPPASSTPVKKTSKTRPSTTEPSWLTLCGIEEDEEEEEDVVVEEEEEEEETHPYRETLASIMAYDPNSED